MQDLVTAAAIGGATALGTKILTSVSNAVGKIYEPVHYTLMAAAERNAKLRGAKNNAEIALIEAETDAKKQELAIKTGERMFKLEMRRQQVMEAVMLKALQSTKAIEASTSVSATPVNEDWMVNFFESCKDIGDEEMQQIWAKILAGEVAQPGSFSLRTVHGLKLITKQEAQLFTRLCSYQWTLNGDRCLVYYSDHNGKHPHPTLEFEALEHLEHIGFVKHFVGGYQFEFPKGETIPVIYFNREFTFDPNGEPRKKRQVRPVVDAAPGMSLVPTGNVMFTEIGKELSAISGAAPDMEYREKAWDYMEQYGGSLKESETPSTK